MGREFATVGVVGLGMMGAGIVEVFARNGVAVTAVEIDAEALRRGEATLRGSVERAVRRGKLAEADRDALLGRVTFAAGLGALGAADLVIEAVPERLEIKRRLFADLDRVCKPGAILATNTSSLSVTEIAVATGRPGQVIGMHFFNPAPVMKLVEVVRTVVTADDVVADVEALCARLGKVGVTIGDRAGFIANALLFGYLNQAAAMVESRYATREDIDAAMRLGCGLPMGPLTLLDLIGLDTAYEVLDTMYRRGGRDRRHAPVPLIRQMVTAGLLGRKSGRGFYTYEKPGSAVVVPDEATPHPAAEAPGVVKVAVVGSGPEAAGIVEAFAAAGHELVEAADADLVIEAEAGDPALLASLDETCKPGVVLATTASSRPVVELAAATGRPADVVGLHFFGPAVGVVEVVRTIRTSAATVATAAAVCRSLGKQPVVCGDRAGFVVNALLLPYLNDAVKMVEAAYSTPDDIDNAMKLGCGYPTGPFELLDAIGPDVALTLLRAQYREVREPGLSPAPLLEHLVTAGRTFRLG
ncbi:3-hydroxyacyl-CoA dehydrogenase family protein [Dactylosporangium sp. CA-092794]|uniref:3-hydroxyacyl-CoA dehydrogenase family protein n=1 Tax=Dactylosporangium sp. CA-092794 TaxID=3239929 RepID=UPI003D942A23